VPYNNGSARVIELHKTARIESFMKQTRISSGKIAAQSRASISEASGVEFFANESLSPVRNLSAAQPPWSLFVPPILSIDACSERRMYCTVIDPPALLNPDKDRLPKMRE